MTQISSSRRLIVFVRAPELGRLKTRLAADAGDRRALSIYRALAEHTLDVARRVADCRLVVHYAPAGAASVMTRWLGSDIELRAQQEGDLGERLAGAIDDALIHGARSVVVVGTDCPGVTVELVERAFTELERHDVVLGPAIDGGYYMIGVRKAHSTLFLGIPWSTGETLSATLSAARAADLDVSLLDERRDIDTLADWRAWCAEAPEWVGYASARSSGPLPSE